MARRTVIPTSEQVLGKIQNNEELTGKEKDFLNSVWEGATTGKTPAGFMSANDFSQYLGQLNQLRDSPGMQSYAKSMIAEKTGNRFVERYKPLFSSILAGADIVTSLGQINTSNRAIQRLSRPSFGVPSVINPALNQEIYKAQTGTFDAARALSPAKQAILDKYNAQLSQAKQMGGGQMGTTQSLSQAAYNDALRASGELPMVQDNIRRAQQAYAGNLLNIQQQGAIADSQNQLAAQRMNADQYNLDALTAASLGVTGRQNLRNVFTTLPDNFLQSAGRLAPVQNPITEPSGTPYDAYHAQVLSGYANTMARAKNWMNGVFPTTRPVVAPLHPSLSVDDNFPTN